MMKENIPKYMFTCSECGEDFKKLSDACRHLKELHKVHRRRVWNYLIFDEPHSQVKVEYPWILA